MQFSSIDFTSNYFVYRDNKRDKNKKPKRDKNIENCKLKFHNHISEDEINLIDHYSKEFIKILEEINATKFENIKNKIENIRNANFFESNDDIELVIQVMKKYGFSIRYIIKQILGGENFERKEYFSKKENVQTVKPPNLINHNSRILAKLPLRIENDNKVRLILVIIKVKEGKVIYPLFLDIHHYLYSGKNYKEVPKEKMIFEQEFIKRVYRNISMQFIKS